MQETLHQPADGRPASSGSPIQVGPDLHCLPAGPAGRRAWSGGVDSGPDCRSPCRHAANWRPRRQGLPAQRHQVATASGSLQEILAHPDIIPTHHHPLLGRQAPDFELADPDGKAWNLRELLDGRPVVLIFNYGDRCVGCVRRHEVNEDLPLFREVGARVVAISADPPELTRQRFQQYGAFGFPVLSDPGNKVAQAYRVFRPAPDGPRADLFRHGTFVIDRDGTVQWVNVGDAPFRRNPALLYQLAEMEGRLPSVGGTLP